MKKSIFIVIATAVIAVVFYGVRYVGRPVDVMTAKAATKENKISAEGLIVYNESIYSAGVSGTFYSYAGEGERVGKDRLVAAVYDGIVDKEVLQSLSNIDKKIADMEENGADSTIYVSDASSEQAVIENVKDKIIDAVIEDDIGQISGYKNRLENTVGAERGSDTKAELEILQREKKGIEASIRQSKRSIYSANSGIYTTMLDGLEGAVSPSDLSWYMLADFRRLPEPEEGIMGNRTVHAGDAVCKVVDNHIWYAVCAVDRDECADVEVGRNVKLRVKELPGEVVSAKVKYISAEPEGVEQCLVIVECERYLEGVFSIRRSDVEIIFDSFYGFEVPIHAIRARDGKNGVMVRNGSYEIFKECKILNRNEETKTVIIEPTGNSNMLEAGDMIVLGEK